MNRLRELLAAAANLDEYEGDLSELRAQIEEAVMELVESGDRSDEALELVGQAAEITAAIDERIEAEAAEAAEREERMNAAVQRIRSQEESEGDEDGETPDGEPVEDEPAEETPAEETDPVDEPAEETEPEAVAAATPARVPPVRATARVAAPRPATARPVPSDPGNVASLVAAANVPGIGAGTRLDEEKLSRALIETWKAMRGLSIRPGMRVPVATIDVRDRFPKELWLDRDVQSNMAKIERFCSLDAVTAAGGLCAPLAVRYDLAGVGVADRPVRQGLTRFGADRGGIRYMSPPVLTDIATTGDDRAITIWTEANDTTPSDPTTKQCMVVDCGSELDEVVDAIVTCLQFGNFMARTFPEWVSRFVELAAIAGAREAESRLLTKVGTDSTAITAGEVLGTTRNVLSIIDRAAAGMRNRHRMRPDTPLRMMAPAWLRDQIRTDIARQLPVGTNDETLAVADAEIDGWFAARRINLSWFLDGETGQIFGAQVDGGLNPWPDSVVFYLFHEGAWIFLDGGELNLGVVRDSTLNSTNDFQMFSEIFEQAAFVGVESMRISADVCPDGSVAATADTSAVCTSGS